MDKNKNNWIWPDYPEFLIEFKKEYERIQPNDSITFDKYSINMPNRKLTERFYSKKWSELKHDAGIGVQPQFLPYDDFVELLKKLSQDNSMLSLNFLRTHQITINLIISRFGSVENMYNSLGIDRKIKTPSNTNKTNEEMLEDYIILSNKLKHAATVTDLDADNTIASSDQYISRFTSINNVRQLTGFKVDKRVLTSFDFSQIEAIMSDVYNKHGIMSQLKLCEVLREEHRIGMSTVFRYYKTTKITELWKRIAKAP